MIAEALTLLLDLKAKAVAPALLPSPDPRKALYVINGQTEWVELPRKPRDHKAGTLAEVIALANRFAKVDGMNPVAWYDAQRVILTIDDDNHRVEHATFELEESDVFKAIVELYAKRSQNPSLWLEPKPFIRLLRITLAGTLDPVMLLNAVRNLKFDNASSTRVETQRMKESMGREITSKVEAGAELPEDVTLRAPVYKTPGETDRLGIKCAVECDPTEGKLQLVPFPDEIERVRQLAVDSIAERLTEGLAEGIAHYQGKP